MHVEVQAAQPTPASTQRPISLEIRAAPNLGLAVEQVAEIQSFLDSSIMPCIESDALRGLQLTLKVYIVLGEEATTRAFAGLLEAALRALEGAGVPVLGIPVARPLRDRFVALTLPGRDLAVSVYRPDE